MAPARLPPGGPEAKGAAPPPPPASDQDAAKGTEVAVGIALEQSKRGAAPGRPEQPAPRTGVLDDGGGSPAEPSREDLARELADALDADGPRVIVANI